MADLLLELYVVGHARNSQAAVANLRRLCDDKLRGRCTLQIVDILENPEAAEKANIIATPTLIRRVPLPIRRIVGDLSFPDMVLDALRSDCVDDLGLPKGHGTDGR